MSEKELELQIKIKLLEIQLLAESSSNERTKVIAQQAEESLKILQANFIEKRETPQPFFTLGTPFTPVIIIVFGLIAIAALTFSHATESLKDTAAEGGENSSINILYRSYC